MHGQNREWESVREIEGSQDEWSRRRIERQRVKKEKKINKYLTTRNQRRVRETEQLGNNNKNTEIQQQQPMESQYRNLNENSYIGESGVFTNNVK